MFKELVSAGFRLGSTIAQGASHVFYGHLLGT